MALGRVDHQLEQTIPSLTFKFKKILVVADRLQALKLMVWKSLLQSINLDMRKPAGWLFETQTVFHARQRELEKAIREKHCWGSVTSVLWSRLLWLSSKHHISRDWARACINRRDGTCLGEQGGRRCWLMRRSKRNLSSCLFSQEVPAGECVQMFKQHQKFQKRFGWVRPGTAASLSGLDGGWRQGFREAVESFALTMLKTPSSVSMVTRSTLHWRRIPHGTHRFLFNRNWFFPIERASLWWCLLATSLRM